MTTTQVHCPCGAVTIELRGGSSSVFRSAFCASSFSAWASSRIAIFQPPVSAPAGATEVKVPVVARIGPDWEEGVWMLRFTTDNGFAGSGQFWLADDPEHFHFTMPTPGPRR